MSSVWNTAESLLLGAGDSTATSPSQDPANILNESTGTRRSISAHRSTGSPSHNVSSLYSKSTFGSKNQNNVGMTVTRTPSKESNQQILSSSNFPTQFQRTNDSNNSFIIEGSECYTDNVDDDCVGSNVTISSGNVVDYSTGFSDDNSKVNKSYVQQNLNHGGGSGSLSSSYITNENRNVIMRQNHIDELESFDMTENANSQDEEPEEDCESIDVCGDEDEFAISEENSKLSASHPGRTNIIREKSKESTNNYSNNNNSRVLSSETAAVSNDNTSFIGDTENSFFGDTTSSAPAAATVRGRGRPRGSRGIGRGRGRGYLPPAVAEGLARHEAVRQRAYKAKYKEMKEVARSLVLENGALCDIVADVQQKIILANEERRFLLRKLHAASQNTSSKDNPFSRLDPNAWSLLDGRAATPPTGTTTSITDATQNNNGLTTNSNTIGGDAGSGSAGEKSTGTFSVKRSRGQQNGRSSGRGNNNNSSSKSKRLCPPITLDSAGRPIFPISLGPLTIHSLGEIVSERPSYHRPHVIFPVGFCSSRTYASVSNPMQPATYTCKILDAGQVPRFEIVCEEPETGEERVFGGSSPVECHNLVLEAIGTAHDMPHAILATSAESNNINDRGLRFFGLSHPSVQNVLQACPGARKCHLYHWIKFEVCRSESEVEKVLEGERDTGLCHQTLLRNIMFASQVS